MRTDLQDGAVLHHKYFNLVSMEAEASRTPLSKLKTAKYSKSTSKW